MDHLNSLNNLFDLVADFHEKFNHPIRYSPNRLDQDRLNKRIQWMEEEIKELRESSDIYEQADALIDLIYFAIGTFVEMGIYPQKLFDIVHTSNMSKLHPDGKPRYHSDGKTKKPAEWEDPYYKIKSYIDKI